MNTRLAVLIGLMMAAAVARADEQSTTPLDAPNDAIMAGDGELREARDWAATALLGDRPANTMDSFLETAVPFSFRLGGAASSTLLKSWPRETSSSDAADRRRHRIAWTDPKTGLRVTAEAAVFHRYPAVEWLVYFENQGKQDTPILEDIQTLDVGLRTSDASRPVRWHRLWGDNCDERSFLPYETAVGAGEKAAMAPRGGRPASTTAFPFFNVQYGDRGLLVGVGWTGQWAASLERTQAGPTRLRAGMERTHLVLHPGEKIRGPRVLLMPWQGDRLAAHQRFRRLLMFGYAPRQAGRPVTLPLSMSCFDLYFAKRPEWNTEAGQIDAARTAHDLGFDHHWLDAAWFPRGFPDGVGTWSCDPKKYPRGLKPVSDACHAMGMKFILWFEPERVARYSQIAREHPEFVHASHPGRAWYESPLEGLFKLDDPAARRWLTDELSRRIEEYGVDIFRSDFNIDPLPYWRRADAPDRQGITEIRYVEGLYAMWDELLARHPGLWIDNCASGGRRIDLETTMRSLPLWRSDINCTPGRTTWNQTQTQGLSLYVPLSAGGTWLPEARYARSSATAGLACEFDYLGPAFPRDTVKAAIAEFRENQKYWYGDFYPLTPATPAEDQWAAYQFHRQDLNAGLVLAFRRDAAISPKLTVKLGAVDPAKDYAVEFIDEARRKVEKTLSGRELAAGLTLSAAPGESLVVRYRPSSH